MIIYQEAFPYNVYHQYSVPQFLKQLRIYVLVLNLGHSPLYRHFCKYLYIELLKFRLFFNYYIHFLRLTIRKQAFIVLTYRKCWHIANPLYFMVFGCTRHSSNKLGSTLIYTKIRSGRMLKKSLQPLNILDKVFTLKNSNKLDSVRLIRLLDKVFTLKISNKFDSIRLIRLLISISFCMLFMAIITP